MAKKKREAAGGVAKVKTVAEKAQEVKNKMTVDGGEPEAAKKNNARCEL